MPRGERLEAGEGDQAVLPTSLGLCARSLPEVPASPLSGFPRKERKLV